MSTRGYTKQQAGKIKNGIDLDIARIEDAALRMRHRVGDIGVGTAPVEIQLEKLRDVARELKAIVDRRTRT